MHRRPPRYDDDDDDDDDHANGVRLRLWTAAINGPIVHPSGDIWVRRTVVEWYRQKKTPDSSTRALWWTSRDIWLEAGGMLERNENLALQSISVHTCKWFFTCRKILWHGAGVWTFLPKEVVLQTIIALKNPISSAGYQPANFGSNGKHSKHYTIDATKPKEVDFALRTDFLRILWKIF
jgi:hypothetical protein